MIRCFVTVGTSSFDSLVRAIEAIQVDGLEFFIQYGFSSVKPQRHNSAEWVADLSARIKEYDLVVCHAGAGTVYSTLELGLPMVVVPNTERVDLHQLELAKYIFDNGYSEVVFNIHELEHAILKVANQTGTYKKYKKEEFFVMPEIVSIIEQREIE